MICPKCGNDKFPVISDYLAKFHWPTELLSITNIRDLGEDDSGIHGLIWTETWICHNCGEKFDYENGSV